MQRSMVLDINKLYNGAYILVDLHNREWLVFHIFISGLEPVPSDCVKPNYCVRPDCAGRA